MDVAGMRALNANITGSTPLSCRRPKTGAGFEAVSPDTPARHMNQKYLPAAACVSHGGHCDGGKRHPQAPCAPAWRFLLAGSGALAFTPAVPLVSLSPDRAEFR